MNLPICHLDGLHHLKDWGIRDKDERDEMIIKKINEERWVIDGTYPTTLDLRLERSESGRTLEYYISKDINKIKFLKTGQLEFNYRWRYYRWKN